jgi:hypothetical protein
MISGIPEEGRAISGSVSAMVSHEHFALPQSIDRNAVSAQFPRQRNFVRSRRESSALVYAPRR